MDIHGGSALRGKKIVSCARSPRARTYAAGRTCSFPGCTTRLSVYNPSSTCACHAEAARASRKRSCDQPLRREPETRACAFEPCAREFVTANPARKYCSDACRMRAFQQRTAAARRACATVAERAAV